jgi:hypothetical protein
MPDILPKSECCGLPAFEKALAIARGSAMNADGDRRLAANWGQYAKMMPSDVIEAAEKSSLRRVYVGVMLSLVAIMVVGTAVMWRADVRSSGISDFDIFYMASELIQRGQITEAYDFKAFTKFQQELLGNAYMVTWNYPPPYNLVVAPLALLPRGVAYAAFIGTAAAAYILTLHRLAADQFVTLLTLLLVPIGVVIFCGQNGLLTGTLVGLTCLWLRDDRARAGVPLGLLIIKPQFALALGLYVLVSRRWPVVLVAAATVATACLLPILFFGSAIWPAFLGGMTRIVDLLQGHFYPFYRMSSAFSTFRSMGMSPATAMNAQFAVTLAALVSVIVAHFRLSRSQAIGIAAFASVMTTPFGYDYDLPIMGIGLALLLPDLIRLGSRLERSLIYIIVLVSTCYGLVRLLSIPAGDAGRSPVGVLIIIGFIIIWNVLWRDRDVAASPASVALS